MSERFIEVMKSGFRLLTYHSFCLNLYIKILNMFRVLINYLNLYYIFMLIRFGIGCYNLILD